MSGHCAPCPTKALARSPRTPWEEASAEPPQPGQHDNEDSYGKVREEQENGTMVVVEYLGVVQEDAMEGLL